jgi:hypothetical protein
MSRGRVENRARKIYDFLVLNLNEGFTIGELCKRCDITDGTTTRSAIRRARDLATEAGYHFPPAIAANEFTYRVTNLAEHALDPSNQMSRIERGVRLRKEDGIEFMRRERKSLPSDLRPVVDMQISMYDATKKALATIQQAADDMVLALIKSRTEGRRESK